MARRTFAYSPVPIATGEEFGDAAVVPLHDVPRAQVESGVVQDAAAALVCDGVSALISDGGVYAPLDDGPEEWEAVRHSARPFDVGRGDRLWKVAHVVSLALLPTVSVPMVDLSERHKAMIKDK